jgi:3-phosphoshikimate 1-carboxyvinyltransferase
MKINIETIGKLQADVSVPGSKSYTQRALVTAALASGTSRLRNVLFSEDTDQFINALKVLGVTVTRDEKDVIVEGTNGIIRTPEASIHLGNNGTAMRFLASLVSLGQGPVVLTGDRRLCERPIKPLMMYLENLGVNYKYLEHSGYPPVEIQGSGLRGGTLTIQNTESSQYISSLLLAAPYADHQVVMNLEGDIVSRPYIEMTLQVMADFGVEVKEESPGSYAVPCGAGYKGRNYVIDGDASSASYFFLAAMICKGVVRVHNMNSNSRQGDLKILDLLTDVGGAVTWGGTWIEVRGGDLKTGDRVIDMGDMPDMVPTIAVLSAFCKGTTKIDRVAHLRIKESNRLAALVTELNKIGATAREEGDSLMISGGELHGAKIDTYNDHRIAMSFAVAGLIVPGITIQNPRCVDKSFPGFWDELKKLG